MGTKINQRFSFEPGLNLNTVYGSSAARKFAFCTFSAISVHSTLFFCYITLFHNSLSLVACEIEFCPDMAFETALALDINLSLSSLPQNLGV